MDGHPALRVLVQAAGVVLVCTILLDVFLTVLYARIHSGIISNHIGGWTWCCFRAVANLFPRRRDRILTYCGPVILVVMVAIWVLGLMLGGGLLVWPALGRSIQATTGD